jgi:hypothetical protein
MRLKPQKPITDKSIIAPALDGAYEHGFIRYRKREKTTRIARPTRAYKKVRPKAFPDLIANSLSNGKSDRTILTPTTIKDKIAKRTETTVDVVTE